MAKIKLVILFLFLSFSQDSKQLISNFYDAFNSQDVPKMMSFVSDSIHYFYIDGNKLIPDAKNKRELTDGMNSYFTSHKTTKSVIEKIMVSGSYVSIKERVFWMSDGKEKSQFALGIYQVQLGKIQRVWYYPAEK